MRFDLTEEQERVRETARRFLENEAPLATLRKQFDRAEGFSRDWWRKISELGWTGLGVPEGAGGFPLTGNVGQDLAIVAEEMGRLLAAGPFQPTVVVLDALVQSPPGADSAPLDAIIAGESVIAWAFGEPGGRWDPASFQTQAQFVRDEVLIDGVKAYVEAGAEADVVLVTARSERGLTQVLAPTDASGVTVFPGRSVDFVRRFAELRFESVRLPSSMIVGERGASDKQVQRQLQLALLLQCAETNGAVERAFEFTVDYMRQRYAFGRPIASYQALKHRLADMLMWIHSCMASVDAALVAFDAGAPETAELVSVAKTYVGFKSSAIISDLVQLTGGIAVTWDHDLHLYERRVAVNRAMFGSPEQHRANVFQLISA